MDYLDDEDAFDGPDAYVDEDDEYDVDYEVAEDDHDITEEGEEDDDELDTQRQSIVDMLNSMAFFSFSKSGLTMYGTGAFVSVAPEGQDIESTGRNTILTSSLTMDQVRLLLAAAQSHGLRTTMNVPGGDHYQEDDDPDYTPPDEEEEEEEEGDNLGFSLGLGPRPRAAKVWFKPVTEPQEAGVRLIYGGEFGRLAAKKNRNIRRMFKERESKVPRHGQGLHKEDFARRLIPNTDGTVVASYGSNAYSGQYSADSSFYYTCCQDWLLHVYDTKAPLESVHDSGRPRQRIMDDHDHESTMKTIKTVQAVPGSWTITDSHLSPDNERLIYSSITSTVYMTKTFEPSAPQIPLKFSSGAGRRRTWDSDADDFGIYSCRFSADGNEVVAGGNGSTGGELRVYDLTAERRTIVIEAHENDVNSCCWADTSSGNILISGSDDSFVKVWDRRSLGSTKKPSGVLAGHTEGITYVSAKGDGRYIISNGKDQAIRLWDLRKMHSNADFEKIGSKFYGRPGFDYRYNGTYPKPKHEAHPRDCSVMTYRGHQVFRTLIRCYFSPIETTGANYIYTGSSDGKIHIYSLDGRIVQILDRGNTLPISFDPSEPVPPDRGTRAPVCVRDVNWHSQEPVIMSVGWESGYGRSSVARHEWKGIGKFGDGMGKLEDYVEKTRLQNSERRYETRSATRSRMPGSFSFENED